MPWHDGVPGCVLFFTEVVAATAATAAAAATAATAAPPAPPGAHEQQQ